jgi:hypothetical protein
MLIYTRHVVGLPFISRQENKSRKEDVHGPDEELLFVGSFDRSPNDNGSK